MSSGQKFDVRLGLGVPPTTKRNSNAGNLNAALCLRLGASLSKTDTVRSRVARWASRLLLKVSHLASARWWSLASLRWKASLREWALLLNAPYKIPKPINPFMPLV